ncbi:MAG TPA: hypothetical protein DDW65_08105 [Firmicutes bacterium]|jgi:hypothetical protein|nr:hypothetical protein [Bacillota bacterium]
MFRKIILCCLGLLIIGTGLVSANDYSPRVGEVLHYKVIVKSAIYGADQTVKVVSKGVYNGREVYTIHSEMWAIGLVKGIHNYRQVEDLIMDADGFYPWVIKVNTQDANKSKQEEVRFDYAAKKAFRSVIKNDEPQKNSEIELPGPVQDGLSLLFFLCRDKVADSENQIYFYGNGSIDHITFTTKQATQPVQLDCGTYTKYLQIFDNVSRITVLVTQSPSRIPIVVKKMAKFGMIEMKLSQIQ